MPRRDSPGPGVPVSSSYAGRFEPFVDAVGGVTFESTPLNVQGLPRLNFWLRQIVGAVGSVCTLQFSVTSVAGGVPALNWLPLPGSPFALPGAGAPPIIVNFILPVNFIRVVILTPAAQPTTVQVYPSASI